MCEIMAINGRRHVAVNRLLKPFFEHSIMHPHGWGIAWRDNSRVVVVKEPLAAYQSSVLKFTLDEPIRTRKLIAHIRFASRGKISYHNCHPFIGKDSTERSWIVAHNGTIVDDALLEDYMEWEVGETDSEQIMLYLIDAINKAIAVKGSDLSDEERFSVIETVMFELSRGNKLNLAIDDDRYLYVHTNTVRDTLFVHYEPNKSALICTQPIEGIEGWEPLPHNRLIAFRHGELCRIGEEGSISFDDIAFLENLSDEERAIQLRSAGLASLLENK